MSLYIAEDMQAGDILTPKNLRAIRPGSGLPTKYYDVLLGKSVKADVKKGTPVSWEMVMSGDK
ncbi:SAF domain-containing protein [Moorena sp. SIOASIH]|uniref:SAF domain-containing protein n=1 Tax=Moorena sp. SIOASIH TaxID=2607817 RepID=UPI0025FC0A44|nr:SAF domain-containing protein [Moorena sp. SIOASIH]